jgi:uncharacterized protein YkwD
MAVLVALLSTVTVGTTAVEATPTRTASGNTSGGSAYEVWRMDRSTAGENNYHLRVWRGTNRRSSPPTCTYAFPSGRDALAFWNQISRLAGCPYQSTSSSGQNSTTNSTSASSRTQRTTPALPSITTVSGDGSSLTCNVAEQEQAALAHLNWMRQNPAAAGRQLGLNLNGVRPQPPLRANAILTQVARSRAEDMGQRRYFGHVDPDGNGPNIKVAQAGYPLPRHFLRGRDSNFIESLVAGRATGVEGINTLIIDAGINPPGHRIHLLALSDFFQQHTEVGIGFACVPGSPYRYYMAVLTAYPER